MAKKVTAIIKLQVNAAKATPAPPIGPAEKMVMLGVTGTNGKTTSTYLLKHILYSCYKLTKS